MGTTTSHHHHGIDSMAMDQPIYDMNVIFKGIPKMMQVADDMHVLSQAVIDMRNLTYALSFMMLLGMCLFLVLKCLQGRRGKTRRRRRLQDHTDSEQSSLSRPYRKYTQKPLDWNHHHKVDMEKLLEHSSSSHGSQHTPPSITPKHVPDFHLVERTPPPILQTTTLPTQNVHNNTVSKLVQATALDCKIDFVPANRQLRRPPGPHKAGRRRHRIRR